MSSCYKWLQKAYREKEWLLVDLCYELRKRGWYATVLTGKGLPILKVRGPDSLKKLRGKRLSK